MSPLREGFDDSSETRCANGVSVDNKLNNYSNDSLKERNNFNDKENNITRSKSPSNGNAATETTSSNDKILHDSQDDEKARAFRSQFDEIRCASKMFEYFRNNRHQGLAGRAPSAPLQKRINESGINSFHQRSHSHSAHPQQTNRHMLRHQRSTSSIQGLSFNGNPSAFKFYPTHGLPTTQSPYNSYGFDNTDDLLRRPMYRFDDSSSVNGNDDSFMKFRDLENGGGRLGFNNSRFVSNSDEWDDSSPGYPSTPLSNGPFTPLTPTSTYSSLSPSTPYFVQPNSFLDDEELNEKAKRLEEERLLLQIQQRKLEIAAHRLRYHHSDPSLNETEARYKLNNATSPPMIPTRGKTLPTKPSFGIKLTAPPPRFQNSQEPIGTPIKKSGYITPPSTTGSSNSSLSMSAPTFSLFSNPPTLSFNNNLMNQQKKHHRTTSCDNNSNGRISPFYGFPLTPSSSPPKTSDGYFGFNSYTKPSNISNNCWTNNNENSYPNTLSPTVFTTPSPGYFRAPLYSTPVDEREEDSLFADEYFSNLNNKKDYYGNYSFAIDDHHWLD